MTNSPAAWTHCADVSIAVPATRAYRYLMNGLELGRWALGSFATEEISPGIFKGTSLFDDQACLVQPVGDEKRLRIEYHVGQTAGALVPRIVAQIVPGNQLGEPADVCVLSLLAWRHRDMSEDRWLQLQRSHELEVLLIRARLERWQDH